MNAKQSPRRRPGAANTHISILSFSEVKTAARGRWRDILAALGVAETFLKSKHGPCPACGGRDRFRFDDKNGAGTWFCNGCGAGDGIKLLSLCLNRSPGECKNLVAEFLNISPSPVVSNKPSTSQKKGRSQRSDSKAAIQRITAECICADEDTVAYRYLTEVRGLEPPETENLAYHPAMPYRDDDLEVITGKYPCLIGRVQSLNGTTVSLHRIYLDAETAEKAPVSNPKKSFPPLYEGAMNGAAVRLGEPEDDVLGVCEGIETGLYCQQATGLPVWAGLTAQGVRSMKVPKEVDHVVVFADNDRNGTGQKAASALAERLVGEGVKVKILIPPTPGHDWLDEGAIPDVATFPFFEQPGKGDGGEQGTGLERLWLEEKPLQRELPAPEEFPLAALGSLEPVARKLSDVIQAPPAICAFSLLAAANLAACPHADVEIDGRVSPISIFFVSVANSGERKTAVDTEALRAHRDWQERRLHVYTGDYHTYEDEVQIYRSEKSRILAGRKTTMTAKKKEIAALEEPIEPLKPILLIGEPTYEGLCKQLVSGLPFCGLFSDEGGRFLGGHAMSDDHQLKTAAGLSGLWDRGEVDRMRSGDGTTIGYGKRLALHLMLQPEVSARLLADRSLKDQGLLSRCLVVRPESRRKTYAAVDLSREPVLIDYWRNIRSILEHPAPLREGQRNSLAPRRLVLSPEAKAGYIDFHNMIQSSVCAGERLEPIKGFAAKAHDHAARLAATLALYEDLGCGEIKDRHYHCAVEIVLHCISELLRLIDAEMSEPELLDAETLLDWLKRRGKRFVSLIEIYRSGPNAVRSAQKARRLMEVLYQHGHVRPCMKEREGTGTSRKEGYEVRAFADVGGCENSHDSHSMRTPEIQARQ